MKYVSALTYDAVVAFLRSLGINAAEEFRFMALDGYDHVRAL